MAKKRKPYGYLMRNGHSINIVLHSCARPTASAFEVSVCFTFLQCFFVVYLMTLSVGRQQKE